MRLTIYMRGAFSHGETPDDCRLMLRKAHESLKPGRLVAVQEILAHRRGSLRCRCVRSQATAGRTRSS